MPAPVRYPDAVLIVVDHLAANLTEPVRTKVPNPRPTVFLIVTRSGGPAANVVADRPTITVESWAATEEDAQDLAQSARRLIRAMRGTVVSGVPIYRVEEFAGPANLPDPLSDQARYVQTFSIAMRGSTAVDPGS